MDDVTTRSDALRLVHLRFKPLWLYVDAVREFCGFFARASFEDPDVGQRVGLVVHELVENAIRYGDDQDLELHLERKENTVVVCVANTTTEDRAARLREVFGDLTRVSAEEAYGRALRKVAGLPEAESGLGLPRVQYEGRVSLALELSEGRVSITARGTL